MRKHTAIKDPEPVANATPISKIVFPVTFNGEARAELAPIGVFVCPEDMIARNFYIKVDGITEFQLKVGNTKLIGDALMKERGFELSHKIKQGDTISLEARSIDDHFNQVLSTVTLETGK